MRKYKLRLVDGTDDQYTVHTDNFGTMLCGEQYEDFVRQYEFEDFVEENKKLRELNKALIEGLEGHFGQIFWESPLGKHVIAALEGISK